MIEIIPRAKWGARHKNGFGVAPLPANDVWLHHSVTLAPDLIWIDTDKDGVEDDEEKAMRLLEDIGQANFGGGISYTWLIPPSGRVYEGHGVGRIGSHTVGRNSTSRAICLIGNYSLYRPTPMQIQSCAYLLRDAKAAGWIKSAKLAGGHRDIKSTECPGNLAYQSIPSINNYVELDMPDSPGVQDLAYRVFDFLQEHEKQTGGPGVNQNLPMVTNLKALVWRVEALINGRDNVAGGPTGPKTVNGIVIPGESVTLVKTLNEINDKLDTLLATNR